MNTQILAEWLQCPVTDNPARTVKRFRLDSRFIEDGDVFVAFRGERVDGHDFIAQAVSRGAVAVISERWQSGIDILQLIVPCALHALAVLATRHRQSLHYPIAALTGSNGKTSVKEMIAAMLPEPSYATRGNLNNQLGVPLSLLECSSDYRYAVFELGASQPGDIAYTVAMVQPDVALVNNIAPAHIAGFGSMDGVANTKGEIYQGLCAGGTAVINEDDDYAHYWDPLLSDKKNLRFSLHKPVDFYVEALRFNDQGCAKCTLVTPEGKAPFMLHVPGEHTVRNALAASACAYALGIGMDNIVRGLSAFRGVSGRMTFLRGKQDSVIIDDTYNANLQSVLTAINVLSQRQGLKILVLGDMGELGAWTAAHHAEAGHAAKAKGIHKVLTCGKYSLSTSHAFGEGGAHYATHQALLEDLSRQLTADTMVLVKGSRASAMERIVQGLLYVSSSSR